MKMSKTYLKVILASVLAVCQVSCDLNKYPDDAINTDESMESLADCQSFLNGLYSGMKYCFTGAFVYIPELQADTFHAVKNFGNFSGDFYSYSVTAGNTSANDAWYGLYGYIGNANFLIDGTQKLLERGTLSESDAEAVKEIYGEASYIRAHLYYLLAQFFCEDYDPSTCSDVMGVPVVTKYDPTGDSKKYPGRPSLEATYAQILSDIAVAEEYVKREGVQNSAYVTKDVVTAFKARVALVMHDYDTALISAKSLIDAGHYTVCTDAAKFADGWKNDNLTETIWQVAMTGPDDTGNSFRYFIYNNSGVVGEDNPQYIPEDWVLKLYDQSKDIRYSSWFSTRDISTPVQGRMTLMVKYPGNPKLYSSVTNYVNMPKVFRLPEMYLIAAEAAANKAGQEAVASYYLNALKSKRISGWVDVDYSGASLTNAIRDERVRELFCEGQRLSDLKRWHIGFSRSAGQDPSLVMPGDKYAGAVRPADDPFFLWPIPTAEMEANPQMKQNPAYTN